jgi:N-acetyl-anhydromuramoyl-L-alanine amidase
MHINAQGWLQADLSGVAASVLSHSPAPTSVNVPGLAVTDPVIAPAARIRRTPSAHFDQRPPGSPIDTLVVHNISLPAGVYGGDQIQALFQGELDTTQEAAFADLKGLRVSSHFLIRRDGELLQFVSTHDRAWHAGESFFQGRTRCNDFSIGIELEGCDTDPFEPVQITQLISLAQCLVRHHPALAWIVGHSDIAPNRKTDPGPHFPWTKVLTQMRALGLALQNPCRT